MSSMKIDRDKLENIINALKEASDHLDYCGYGDSWERGVNDGDDPLNKKIEEALSIGNKELESTK